jgi:hypothetical protein
VAPIIPLVTTTSKPRRRWFQYSLRTLLVLMLLVCIGVGFVTVRMQLSRKKREVVRLAVSPPAGHEVLARHVQKEDGPKLMHSNVDENYLPTRLLGADVVQKDLGLTADQMGKIADLVKFSKEETRGLATIWHEMSQDEAAQRSEVRTQELVARTERVASKYKELQAQVVGMLTPIQRERLKQIQLQYAIAVALTQPEFIKALDISEEQLERIRKHAMASALARPDVFKALDISEERLLSTRLPSDRSTERGLAELREFDGLNPDDTFQKMMELSQKRDKTHAEANRLALEVLTPEQRAKLAKFVGQEIELTWDYDAMMRDD